MAMPGRHRFALALAILLTFAAPTAAQKKTQAPPPSPPVAIEVEGRPIADFDQREPGRRLFGQLEFRGGLVLTSRFKEFGGLSSISVAPDGSNFIAITDRSWWLRGRIVYDSTRPTGIADAEMAPMLGPDGRTLMSRRWWDTEALARDGGTLYVAIERVQRIVRFHYGQDGLRARGRPIVVPPAFRSLPPNGSIEGLVFVPRGRPLGGTLVAISERGLNPNGDVRGFLIGGPRPGEFAIRRKDDFDITDTTLLPGGDLLILERKFGWTTGLFVRIRRLALAELRPGALLDGPALLQADLGHQIDNMEGISAHRSGGETVLTLVSDDNFSALQRTLLLQFTLAGP
jgi:hypothetical protein